MGDFGFESQPALVPFLGDNQMRQELLDEYLTRISNNLERLADANEKIATTLSSIDLEAWNALKTQPKQPPTIKITNQFLEEHLVKIQAYTQATPEEIEAIKSKILDLSKETTMTLSDSIQCVIRLALAGYSISQILKYQPTT